MADVRTETRNYVLENFLMGGEAAELKDDQSFLEHHIIDSTGFIELVTHLETSYGIQINDHEMIPENLDSIEAISRFVNAKLER